LASSLTDTAAVEAVDVILRDGGTLRLRPPDPGDSASGLMTLSDDRPASGWDLRSDFVSGMRRRGLTVHFNWG
jgi:hypothetical protein